MFNSGLEEIIIMSSLLEAIILLVVITDPIVSVAAFLSLTRNKKPRERRRIAAKAVSVALIVFLLFAFGGDLALRGLGVDLNTFKAAGGIILVLLGVQMSLGLTFPKDKEDVSEIAVVIGTPLISGPATITTTMILVKDIGLAITLLSGAVAFFVILLSLLMSQGISRLLGKSGIRVLSTMMGIVTIAWGIQFLLAGIAGFLA
jgi:multiple antibiotic resistance protein